jgi:hypothetical protein
MSWVGRTGVGVGGLPPALNKEAVEKAGSKKEPDEGRGLQAGWG